MWSPLRWVTLRLTSSYTLETLDGRLFNGKFSARQLREFIPRKGTKLADEQEGWAAKAGDEELRMAEEEKREVEQMREED